jgi:hypothetical protein
MTVATIAAAAVVVVVVVLLVITVTMANLKGARVALSVCWNTFYHF